MKQLTQALLENLKEGDLIYKYPFASYGVVDEYNPEDINNISPFIVDIINAGEVSLSKIDTTSIDLYNITLKYTFVELLNGQFWMKDSFTEDNYA